MAKTITDPHIATGAGDGHDVYLTPEEGRREFEAAARKWMNMGGEEFIRRWEAGEYWGIADEDGHRHIGDLIMMIPLARQES
ncbi:MAG: hypothetical protein M3462_01760 [Chloroflexota bacterium]|nr:hypothetical protein [Chloroflexota bacterium]